MLHALSLLCALIVCVRQVSTLRISVKDLPRYLGKSANLALCYVGFVSEQNPNQAIRAGMAAFLCCAYDVVTDWRNYNASALAAFDGLLQKYSPQLRYMALDLLEKDQHGKLSRDGLERGIISARFITGIIGSALHFERLADLHRLGMALQVVDDVLDYEADIASGDSNCLNSNHWREHLALLEQTLADAEASRLFPHGTVLRFVIRRAREKAARLTLSKLTTEVDQVIRTGG